MILHPQDGLSGALEDGDISHTNILRAFISKEKQKGRQGLRLSQRNYLNNKTRLKDPVAKTKQELCLTSPQKIKRGVLTICAY